MTSAGRPLVELLSTFGPGSSRAFGAGIVGFRRGEPWSSRPVQHRPRPGSCHAQAGVPRPWTRHVQSTRPNPPLRMEDRA